MFSAQQGLISRAVANKFGESILPEHSFTECFTMMMIYAGLVFLLRTRLAILPKGLVKFVLTFYNAGMSIFSFWMFQGISLALYNNWKNENWEISLIWNDQNLKLFQNMNTYLTAMYWSKHFEYVDTIFILLLSGFDKWNPRVILQFYHHWTTPSMLYFTMHAPFSFGWLGPLTNAFVHTVMYGYYSITYWASKDFRKIGKYIFYIQMVQFFCCLTGSCIVFYTGSYSDPVGFGWIALQYAIFVGLFTKFFMFRTKERTGKKKN